MISMDSVRRVGGQSIRRVGGQRGKGSEQLSEEVGVWWSKREELLKNCYREEKGFHMIDTEQRKLL